MARRSIRMILFLLALLLLGPLSVLMSGKVSLFANWRAANRVSAGLAPNPVIFKGAIVQVYAARAFHWRGLFAVHTWFALKPEGADQYLVFQIIGWNKYYNRPVVVVSQDIPDRYWFGQKPWLVGEITGEKAEAAIPKIIQATKKYPYQSEYRLWPGPNSNTFVAYIVRTVPELHLVMPALAIGKDYLPNHDFFEKTPDGKGYQFSFYGLLGISVSKVARVEINLLGLVVGISIKPFALAWPGIGWVIL